MSHSHYQPSLGHSLFSYVVLNDEFLLVPIEVEAFDVVEELSGGDHVSELQLALVFVYAFPTIGCQDIILLFLVCH